MRSLTTLLLSLAVAVCGVRISLAQEALPIDQRAAAPMTDDIVTPLDSKPGPRSAAAPRACYVRLPDLPQAVYGGFGAYDPSTRMLAYAGGAVQPPKRLVGFAKVELAPGASREVTITVDPAASNHPLSFWSKTYNSWISPAGSYALHVGSSSSPKDLTTLSFTR